MLITDDWNRTKRSLQYHGGNYALLLPNILGCYDLDEIVVHVDSFSLTLLKQGLNLRFIGCLILTWNWSLKGVFWLVCDQCVNLRVLLHFFKVHLRHWGDGSWRWARRSHWGILSDRVDFGGSRLRCVRAVPWRHSFDRAVPRGETHDGTSPGTVCHSRTWLFCGGEAAFLVSQRSFEAVLPLQCCCHPYFLPGYLLWVGVKFPDFWATHSLPPRPRSTFSPLFWCFCFSQLDRCWVAVTHRLHCLHCCEPTRPVNFQSTSTLYLLFEKLSLDNFSNRR